LYSEDPRVKLDSIITGSINIRFGKGSLEISLSIIYIIIEIGTIKFKVIKALISFLLYL